MARRRSVYLSDETDEAIKASGLALPEIIRRGLVRPDLSYPPEPLAGDRGMHLDPRQIPTTLMQPAMEAGQPPAQLPVFREGVHPSACTHPRAARDPKSPSRCRCGALNLAVPR